MALVQLRTRRASGEAARPADIQTALVLALVDGEEYRVRRATDTEIEVECADAIPDALSLTLTVFDVQAWAYQDFSFSAATVVERTELEYSQICRVQLGEPDDEGARASLLACLDEIATLWGAPPRRPGPQGTAPLKDKAHARPQYPPPKKHSYETYAELRRAWFGTDVDDDASASFSEISGRVERAFNACTPGSYDLVTECGPSSAIRTMLREVGIEGHGLFHHPFDRIYLGNEFCPHLFPKLDRLFQMMDQVTEESMAVTINGPYLIESTVDATVELLQSIERWVNTRRQPVELIVNDWGMLELMRDHAPSLTPVLGRLLNKRKKDPRVKWYWGYEAHESHLSETNLNAPWFRAFLSGYGVERFEFEAGPMRATVPGRGHSLHYPFYETNSSVFCMLYAEVTEFYMGRQRLVESCPRYCTDFCYIYPDHLKLIGKGNTIYGFDDDILVQPDSLQRYLEQGVDRIVFSPDC